MVLEVLANLYYYIFFVTRYLIGSRQSRARTIKPLYFPAIVNFSSYPTPFGNHVNFHFMRIKNPEDEQTNHWITSKATFLILFVSEN